MILTLGAIADRGLVVEAGGEGECGGWGERRAREATEHQTVLNAISFWQSTDLIT
jgi:hypothetical protein